MRIKFWGTRGSLPSPYTPHEVEHKIKSIVDDFFIAGYETHEHFEHYWKNLPRLKKGGFGGNTSCTEVSDGTSMIIIDSGTGIRRLGYELMKGPCGKGQGEVSLFFTHFHWDHIIGFPFFTPIYTKGNKIHIYAVQPELESNIRTLFKKPFFPVAYEELVSEIHFHVIPPRLPTHVGSLSVTPYQLDHPDPCWGFRVDAGGKSYGHCVDTECTRTSQKDLGADLPLYQNLDLMLFDAQYTLSDSIKRLYWGHAAATFGLDIAMREGIKKVLFTHSDPSASDADILKAARQTKEYYDNAIKHAKRAKARIHLVQWMFVQEGMVMDI